MSTDIALIVGGVEYPMNDENPFFVNAWDGLGLLPLERLAQAGALQDGDTDLGVRWRPRLFSVTFGISYSCAIADRIRARRLLLQRLAPRICPLALRFTFDYGLPGAVSYQIDCYTISEPGAVNADDVHGLSLIPVRFKASDPSFYDPDRNVVVFALTAPLGGMPVLTPVPTPIGASDLNDTQAITYAGDVRDFPQLRIIGPIKNCVITNTTTGEKLDFTGYTIGPGDWLDIDCRYASKSVNDAAGNNRLYALTDDSDLSTFHLAPSETGAVTQVNIFTVTGSGVTAGTAVTLWYYDRFSGI